LSLWEKRKSLAPPLDRTLSGQAGILVIVPTEPSRILFN
jgi:hypothetical protein